MIKVKNIIENNFVNKKLVQLDCCIGNIFGEVNDRQKAAAKRDSRTAFISEAGSACYPEF